MNAIEDRQGKEIYLAWQYGKLNKDDESLDKISKMTYEELERAIHENGELIDWE